MRDNRFLCELENIDGIKIKKDVKITSTMNISAIFKYEIDIYKLSNISKTIKALKSYNMPFYIIGNCSNILFINEYYDATIIRIIMPSKELSVVSAFDNVININNLYMSKGIESLVFLSGVPASVGGAIYMNAGAYQKEISNIVEYVYFYDIEKEKIQVFDNKSCEFSYRESYFKKHSVIILGAKLKLLYKEKDKIIKEYKDIILKRKERLPLEYPSLGSVFKNFDDIPVGKLIEDASLKGVRVNDALVSEKHANVIVNKGQCNGKDVLGLIKIIKKSVYKRYKRKLELEIIIFE